MKKRVVILGAGFAGLQLARNLDNTLFDITLIDHNNFHQFQPLFYQVATARLEPSAISFPLRKVFQNTPNVHVRVGSVRRVDVTTKSVYTASDTYNFDYLVIATGCTTNFFGNEHFSKYCFPMKSTNEAITLRNRILLNFEDALSASAEDRAAIMNIVIAGGGPTGVELAGALAEMKKYVLPRDYPDMDFSSLTIYLVEGAADTLGSMSESSRAKSKEYLEQLGVNVLVNTTASDYDGNSLVLQSGATIKTRTLIWAAGIRGNVPEGIPQDCIVRGNRIKVNEYNQLAEHEHVFAIGDIACMEAKEYPHGHPQVANVAINQAKLLAKNLKRIILAESVTSFSYKSPGSMATIGKHKAVVDLPAFSFQGRLAWFTWMFLHLMLILSVRNKFFIFINWTISYFTNDTTLRLILTPFYRPADKT